MALKFPEEKELNPVPHSFSITMNVLIKSEKCKIIKRDRKVYMHTIYLYYSDKHGKN